MSRAEMIELAGRLIEVPSVSGEQAANKRALDICAEYLGESVHYKDFEKNGYVSRLWGDPETLMNPRLLLLGHVDVVDVEGNMSLFSPRIENGRLYGRGSGDMKGHDAAMIESFRDRALNEGVHGIGLLLTTDEEIGGFNGAKHVVECGLRADVVFVPDGPFNFDIVKSQKAPHHFVVQAKGPGGHASMAFEIENPVNAIINFYNEVRQTYATATTENPWASTFEMTVIGTDNKSKNRIPDAVTAAFSWRWPLEQIDFQAGRADILRICEKYGCEVLLEEGGGQGCITDPSASYVKEWKQIIEAEIGYGVGFINTHGATDSRYFYNVSEGGSQNILLTSAVTGDHHSEKEWIDINSLAQLSNAISKYMQIR